MAILSIHGAKQRRIVKPPPKLASKILVGSATSKCLLRSPCAFFYSVALLLVSNRTPTVTVTETPAQGLQFVFPHGLIFQNALENQLQPELNFAGCSGSEQWVLPRGVGRLRRLAESITGKTATARVRQNCVI
jgi:hypothetical protein